jgi:hypothetical protein
VNDNLQDTTDAATESCGYSLTEAGNAALEMLKRRAALTRGAETVGVENQSARGHFRPLPYMSKFAPGDDLYYGHDRHRTEYVTIPLREYQAYWNHDADGAVVDMAAIRICLFQPGNLPYPLVEFERMQGDDGERKGPFARYALHLDEAKELAHVLLLLLDVANGVQGGEVK